MNHYKQLRQFKQEELLFNNNETIIILKFIFPVSDHQTIDSLTVNQKLRNFSQGLLVEAIDASYNIGFIESIFRSTSNPAQGAMNVLKKFGRRAAKHWFDHTSLDDLQDVKIYDFVRVGLARNFRTALYIFLAKTEAPERASVFLSYYKPQNTLLKVWG